MFKLFGGFIAGVLAMLLSISWILAERGDNSTCGAVAVDPELASGLAAPFPAFETRPFGVFDVPSIFTLQSFPHGSSA